MARKWCVDGFFFRWWYNIQSLPGDEFDGLFFSSFLTDPGVIADMSKGVISSASGAGITVSTQFGRIE